MAARLSDAAATAAVAAAGEEPAAGTIGQQIADGVQRAMAASPSSEANGTRPAPATGAIAGTFAPAVRTIKLQLNPLSLGTVTIVLTGRDSELSIKIEAERAETVSGVEQERGALTSRLAGAGYAISELTVARMGAASAEGDQRESGSRFASQQQGDGAGGRAAQENAAQSGDRGAGREPDSGRSAARSADTPAARGGALEQVVSGISYSGRFRPV